jgi:predicted SAM-dependent methyltransferase
VKLLNVGCGNTFHPDWINLDAAPVSPAVQAHDLAEPLPFADAQFDAIYASHVFEHFEPDAGMRLLAECRRVLQPAGIVRIAVPDLEAIARTYLQCLEEAPTSREAEARYDWMMLELYDQAVRTKSGGRMAAYLAGPLNESQRRFIADRVGGEVMDTSAPRATKSWLRRSLEACISMLGGNTWREVAFRRRGEVHQWMYDRFSLTRALTQAGFRDVQRRAAGDSDIPGFAGYGLEMVAGRARKPDSLYIEGRKP